MEKKGLKDKLHEIKDNGFERAGNFCKYVGSNIDRATKPIRAHFHTFIQKMQGKGDLVPQPG